MMNGSCGRDCNVVVSRSQSRSARSETRAVFAPSLRSPLEPLNIAFRDLEITDSVFGSTAGCGLLEMTVGVLLISLRNFHH